MTRKYKFETLPMVDSKKNYSWNKSFKGTLYWMAPEMIDNPNLIQHPKCCDIYSVAAIICFLFTKRSPFSYLNITNVT